MQVKRSEAVALFEAFGLETAKGWKPSQMVDNLKQIDDFVPEDFDPAALSDDLRGFMEVVKDANSNSSDFEIENDMKDEKPAAKKPAAKPAAKAGAAPKPAIPPKPAAGPGVIGTIVKILGDATEAKPVTKDEILAKLVKAFPGRQPEAMMKTVSLQLPNRIGRERGIEVQTTKVTRKREDGEKQEYTGYWLDVVPEGAIGRRPRQQQEAAPKPKAAAKPAPKKAAAPAKPAAKPVAAKSGPKKAAAKSK